MWSDLMKRLRPKYPYPIFKAQALTAGVGGGVGEDGDREECIEFISTNLPIFL